MKLSSFNRWTLATSLTLGILTTLAQPSRANSSSARSSGHGPSSAVSVDQNRNNLFFASALIQDMTNLAIDSCLALLDLRLPVGSKYDDRVNYNSINANALKILKTIKTTKVLPTWDILRYDKDNPHSREVPFEITAPNQILFNMTSYLTLAGKEERAMQALRIFGKAAGITERDAIDIVIAAKLSAESVSEQIHDKKIWAQKMAEYGLVDEVKTETYTFGKDTVTVRVGSIQGRGVYIISPNHFVDRKSGATYTFFYPSTSLPDYRPLCETHRRPMQIGFNQDCAFNVFGFFEVQFTSEDPYIRSMAVDHLKLIIEAKEIIAPKVPKTSLLDTSYLDDAIPEEIFQRKVKKNLVWTTASKMFGSFGVSEKQSSLEKFRAATSSEEKRQAFADYAAKTAQFLALSRELSSLNLDALFFAVKGDSYFPDEKAQPSLDQLNFNVVKGNLDFLLVDTEESDIRAYATSLKNNPSSEAQIAASIEESLKAYWSKLIGTFYSAKPIPSAVKNKSKGNSKKGK